MGIESKIKHIFFDDSNDRIKSFNRDEFETELDRIAKTIEAHITKLETIGNFKLDTVKVTIGVKGDILVIGVDGGITITYSKCGCQ